MKATSFRPTTVGCWLAGFLGLCLGAVALRADTLHDAALDFSVTNNPAGPWSYGYTTTLGGDLILFKEHGEERGLLYWRHNLSLGAPSLLVNASDTPFVSGSITFAAHALGFHPGPGNERCVFRFTVPTAGIYQVESSFWAADTGGGGTSTDVHVLVNGIAVFNGIVSTQGGGSSPEFKGREWLSPGDHVDFAVGYGLNGSFFFDSTGLTARLVLLTDLLSIRLLDDGRVEVSWPDMLPARSLESANTLGPTGWSPDPHLPKIIDGRKVVTLEATDTERYFRLGDPAN